MKRLLMPLVISVAMLPIALTRTEMATNLSLNSQAKPDKRVHSLRVLVLSTMLADAGIGEWGFAALVEVGGHRILFDTGAHPDTVLRNARELGVDLSQAFKRSSSATTTSITLADCFIFAVSLPNKIQQRSPVRT